MRARTGPASELVESYRLTKRGMDWVERFFQDPAFGGDDAKARLRNESEQLKRKYGRISLDSLIDHVYEEYPEFAEKSRIRDQVAERRNRAYE